jgi:hypothetical protein
VPDRNPYIYIAFIARFVSKMRAATRKHNCPPFYGASLDTVDGPTGSKASPPSSPPS